MMLSRMISTSTAVDAMASLWCRNFRSTSLPWVRGSGSASGGRAPSLVAVSLARREFKSANANPRVQDAVHQVGDQVGDDHAGGDDHEPAHHHLGVVLVDGFHQQRAHTVPVEHRFGDDRAGEDRPEVHREQRGHGDQGVAERVPEDDPAVREALGSRGAHVVGVHHFEHRGPLEPAVRGEADRHDRQRRQQVGTDRARYEVPDAVRSQLFRAGRAQPWIAEDVLQAEVPDPAVDLDRVVLQHDRDAEDRHREQQEGQRRGEVVDDRVLLHRGEHADDDADDQREDLGPDDQLERDAERRQDLRRDRLQRVALRDGRAPVTRQEVPEPAEVARHDALVQPELVGERVDRVLAQLRVVAELAQRVTGGGDHHERQKGPDQQDGNRYRQTAKDVDHQVQRTAPHPGLVFRSALDRYPVVYRSGGNPTVNSYFRWVPGPGSWPDPGTSQVIWSEGKEEAGRALLLLLPLAGAPQGTVVRLHVHAVD